MSKAASNSFNKYSQLELEGKLNFEILERAFDKVIKAHESLRTIFTKDGTFQNIQPVSIFKLKYSNLISLDEEEKQIILQEKLKNETTILFDFINGPLLES